MKIGIYTACTRSKDSIPTPSIVTPNTQYFCYSEAPARYPIHIPVLINKEDLFLNEGWLGYTKTARKIKAMPHKLDELKDFDITVWTDANIQAIADLTPLIEQIGDNDIALLNHGYRKTLYEEAEELIRISHQNDKNWSLHKYNRDPNIGDVDQLKTLIDEYKSSGLNIDNLWWTAILVRKNNEKVRNAMEDWWIQLQKYHRDQVSFPYIVAKHDLKVKTLSKDNYFESPEFNQYFHYVKHRR